MPPLFIVSPEGVPLVFDKPNIPSADVETKELTLDEIAQREAQKQSRVAHKCVKK